MCVYTGFALMLPRVYFESEERTLHGRQLNPNNIGLKLGPCSLEYFPSVLKCPLEEGAGRRGGRKGLFCLVLCVWPGSVGLLLLLIWYGLVLLSHTLSTWVFCTQAVPAGGLGLLFLTAGSAPLRPHVKLCGNSGGDERAPSNIPQVWVERQAAQGTDTAQGFHLLGCPGWAQGAALGEGLLLLTWILGVLSSQSCGECEGLQLLLNLF